MKKLPFPVFPPSSARIIFFCLLSIFCFQSKLYSQDWNNYQNIKSEGTIPNDFLKLSSQKYAEDRATINQNESYSTQKAKNAFYLSSNFNIDYVLSSGRVLFNDPVSQ